MERLIRALRFDSGPPLFYVVEKPIVAAAEFLALPDSAARVVPLLAIAALFATARDRTVGFRRRFLWLLASSPFLLLYSSEARAYGILALLGFVLFRLAVRESPSPAVLAAIALTAAGLVWSHYLGLVLTLSFLVGASLLHRLRAAAALTLGLFTFLPWVPILLAQPTAATAWIRERPGASLAGFLAAMGGSLHVLPPFGPPLPTALIWLAGALGIAWLAVFFDFFRRTDSESRFGLCAVVLTLTTILLVSLWRPVAVPGRSEMVVLPIWLWLAAVAGEESRPARYAAAATAVLATVSSIYLLASPRASRPFAEVPRELQASAHEGDLIVATANFYLPAVLARERGLLAGELRALPEDLADHPGWHRGRAPSEEDYRLLGDDLARAGQDRTVHLLLDSAYWGPRLQQLLLTRGSFHSSRASPAGLWVVSTGRPLAAH
jgi:hypothetical protein